MLSFVPVTLDLYRTVRRHLHWTLQNLVAFADRTGRCFPSVRTLAAATGQPRSTVSRHLAQLAKEGVIARQRRPGGVYAYVIAGRFLPAREGCPTSAKRVSHRREQKNRQVRKQGTRERDSLNREVSFGEMPDERAKWEARLRSWRKSGFWLPLWGRKPGEAGCLVPVSTAAAEPLPTCALNHGDLAQAQAHSQDQARFPRTARTLANACVRAAAHMGTGHGHTRCAKPLRLPASTAVHCYAVSKVVRCPQPVTP